VRRYASRQVAYVQTFKGGGRAARTSARATVQIKTSRSHFLARRLTYPVRAEREGSANKPRDARRLRFKGGRRSPNVSMIARGRWEAALRSSRRFAEGAAVGPGRRCMTSSARDYMARHRQPAHGRFSGARRSAFSLRSELRQGVKPGAYALNPRRGRQTGFPHFGRDIRGSLLETLQNGLVGNRLGKSRCLRDLSIRLLDVDQQATIPDSTSGPRGAARQGARNRPPVGKTPRGSRSGWPGFLHQGQFPAELLLSARRSSRPRKKKKKRKRKEKKKEEKRGKRRGPSPH